jgi:hypothetical protein
MSDQHDVPWQVPPDPAAGDAIDQAQAIVKRAAAFQQEADAAGYGRPQETPDRPPGRPLVVAWHETGMRASTVVDVAVVRGAKPARCQRCRHRRVLFALTVVTAAIGNPEYPWRCAPCWGLR